MRPRLSVITPTCDRPAALARAEGWMQRQTRRPDEWIVADGGQVAATLTCGQVHIHDPQLPGLPNFARNLTNALAHVTGDLIAIVEDDDWYAPTHLEQIVEYFTRASVGIVGDGSIRYYHVPSRRYRRFCNRASSLCQTALRAELAPAFHAAIAASLAARSFAIDIALWAAVPRDRWCLTQSDTVVGIKGGAGTVGLGAGHRPTGAGWVDDGDGRALRSWLGADAAAYLESRAA